ncbi:MAG TPA: adenylate/guanylate cyclase domain-containing protein [Candidatus Gastranaerophilales bacterium]|nr:adenylate/guanylate cyclase domain-containing protein [Candidatus Gastranaerophilales bacterium]
MNYHKKNLKNYFVLTILSFIFLWSAYALCVNFFSNPIYDFLIRITCPQKTSKEIIVVAIDDQSIKKIGRWPWKRTYYADIFEYLENVAESKLIAFDSVIVSYGQEKYDKEFFKRFSSLNKIIPGVFFSKETDHFEHINEQKLNELFSEKFSVEVKDLRSVYLKEKSGYSSSSYSVEEIINTSKSFGSVLSFPDNDGIIRKTEHLFLYKDSYYPSLAVAVFKQLYPDAKFVLKENLLEINSEEKNFKIPIFSNENGSFSFIKWYKSNDNKHSYPYKTISAWKIIESYKNIRQNKPPLIDSSIFKDKIVVLGATSTALKDIKSTPLKFDYPGIYIQASIIDNLINNDFITRFSKAQDILILFFSIIIGFSAIFYLPPIYSSISLTFLSVGYFYACLFFFYPNNYAPDPVTPVVFIICTMFIGYGYEYFIEDAQKRKTKNLIAKYVSKDIMEEILKNPDSVKLKGKRSDITVLFVDIRNFTSISETTDPQKVSELLNEYFNELIPVIFKYHGTVNKFIGDAVMAIFGAPIECSDHPENAVRCAIEMYERIQDLKLKWEKENKPEINVGIGISTGEAFVGNVGAKERFEYSAIGNTVNIANRLESFNKLYKTSILISETTYNRVKDKIEAEEIDSVCVTQSSEPIKIFELKALRQVN